MAEKRTTALLEAARDGDAARVRELVGEGVAMDAMDSDGKTSLMRASESGHMDVVQLLIDRGADDSAVDNLFGKTVLMYASAGGNMDVVQLLIDRGADVNAVESYGWTALMYASASGHMDVVQFLIDRGADVNAADNRLGKTVLMQASDRGHMDVARLLIDRGADVNAVENSGWTALMYSAEGGHIDVVRFLIDRGADVNAVENDGWTALMYSSAAGHMDVIQLLIDRGADINAVENDGWTALMYALGSGHMDVVQFLIDRGADDNGVDNKNGKTVLMQASGGGHMDAVQFLIDRGADVNAVDNNGKTAVFYAARYGHTAVQQMLTSLLRAAPSAIHSHLNNTEGIKSQSSTRWLVTPFEVALLTQLDRQDTGVQFHAKWLDADVVIKLFIPGSSMVSFADEVTVWRQLRHPNVIKLYGACDIGHCFFVSEFASNGSLVDHLAACRRTGTFCTPWKFLHEAALGLAYLHERKIVHGDLRGSNILIGSDGLAKLSEFSLSESTGGNRTSGVFGSTRWQSPERLKGDEVSLASDVYLLGLCIVEALSGKIPWPDVEEAGVMWQMENWDPVTDPRSTWAPGPLTDDAVDMVHHMCARDPTKRVAASVAAQMLERLATQERAQQQVTRQSEPESTLSIEKFDKYKNGELTRLWTKIQAAVPTYAGNDIHRSVFDEVKAMYEELGESPRSWKLLDQFLKLLVDIEVMVRPDSLHNRIQRLSATRATGFAAVGLQRRLDSIWSALKGSPSELEAYKQQWREQQTNHPELFISVEEQTLLVLKELKTEEDWAMLLTTLRSEIDEHSADYSPDQLAVIQKAYTDLVEHSKSDVVKTTPEWFLPWHELEIDEASCVGAGGFGGVYRGRWLESEVVVKMLDQGDWAISSVLAATAVDREKKKQQREMFEREVSVWFGLSHPHIVRLFGACHIGTLFFACEYASKGSLDRYLRKHPDELWQKLYEAALGVQYLHARGVVHGDLKCNNILVGGDGKAKVTDFGLSSDTAELDKAEPQVSGASHWVAPECLEHGSSKLSTASDVYSLGMCVVEALRVVEQNSQEQGTAIQYPLPWGGLPSAAVKFHVVRLRKLPPRPQPCTDAEWSLVARMCAFEPSNRLKISTVVDELGVLASAKASVAMEAKTPAHEAERMREVVMKTASQSEISVQDVTERVQEITLSRASADVVDSVATESESIPAVIAQMQGCIPSTEEDGNRKVLSQIFGLLWSRLAHLSSVISAAGGDLEHLRELVERAKESTMALSEVEDTLIGFTETAIGGYALHRDLDKLMDANFWRVDINESEVHEWERRCSEFLGVTASQEH